MIVNKVLEKRMAFELFKETRARTKEFISITENKTFGLPRTFLDKQEITDDLKCVILYDEETNQIALHFSDKDPDFGLAVRIPNKNQGGTVVARALFDLKGIDAAKYAGRYDDFKKETLKNLGIDKPGYAYVITLTERAKSPANNENKDEEPVRLEDILF